MIPPDVYSSQGRQQRAEPSGVATSTRIAVRREARAVRKSLPQPIRQRGARAAMRHLAHHRVFRSARHVAVYAAVGSEMDPGPIAELAQKLGKLVYFPVLHGKRLQFVFGGARTRWRRNRFGIAEPRVGKLYRCMPASRLDCVILPLLAFDADGTRLGSGAGYYDRTLAFRRFRASWRKPRLIGLAFALQEEKHLPKAPWDVPLDGILTETGMRFFR